MNADTEMTLENPDWRPPLDCRATWFGPGRWTAREAVLAAALDRLAQHDDADCRRRDAPHCVELQHAIRVLNELAGRELFDERP